jgi:hypothetical protein
MAPKWSCRVPKHLRTEAAPVVLPTEWELPRTLQPKDVVDRLIACFLVQETPGALVWRYFETLQAPELRKVLAHFRNREDAPVCTTRTPAAQLRHWAFEALCNELPDQARRDELMPFVAVLGLTDDDLQHCDSFAAAVSRAGPVIAEMSQAVVDQCIAGARTRTAETVISAVSDRKRPSAAEFNLDAVVRVSATLRRLRVEHFMHRLTTDGLQCRAGLAVSYSALKWSLSAVNADLIDAGLDGHQFDNLDKLYEFVTGALRCEDFDEHMLEFLIGLCVFAENKKDNARKFDRAELIRQVDASRDVSAALRAELYGFPRLLALLDRHERVNPDALTDVSIRLQTMLWFHEKIVVIPKATFSVGDVRERMSQAPTAGPLPTFATALLSLVADALSQWLHRYFDEYGTVPWKDNFRAKWATRPAHSHGSFITVFQNQVPNS